MHLRKFAVTFGLAAIVTVPALIAQDKGVKVTPNESARRVDITVDGKPFTSYIYPTTLKKPVLYPILTARGTAITRGFPLEARAGERVDHPHHVGLWFNHGDVNGLDFWNNSDAIGPDRAPKMGTILHRRVVEAKGGADRGELVVESEWVTAENKPLLRERTHYVFRTGADQRIIERNTTLTAIDQKVTFRDNKEGSLGLRVTRALEQPAERAEIFTDATGKPSKERVLNNEGVTGLYTSSEGLKGDAVWGTRAKWTMLTGTLGSEPVTIAMLDHPSNPTYPTYWHARGYGLFSANVFSRKAFKDTEPEFTLTLEPGKSVTLRHQVLILTGPPSTDAIDRAQQAFAASSTTTSR
jgi:methane monooxygenase PmoA-like